MTKSTTIKTVSDKKVASSQQTSNQSSTTLPQTGNKSGWQLALVGMFSLVGALGLVKKKKRN